MAKQLIGAKKTRLANATGGKTYYACYARGGQEPSSTWDCWFENEDGFRDNADLVDVKRNLVAPLVRRGQFVTLAY